MILAFTVLAGIAIAPLAAGQAPEGKEKLGRTKRVAPSVNGAVTAAEARAVFTRAERVIAATLKVPVLGKVGIAASSRPMTRTQAVTEFSRLFQMASPSFKLTPRPVKFEAQRLKMADPAARQKLTLLVQAGAVAPFGPVASGPSDSLSVKEFGDALGFLLARIAEMSHLPSRKWTPALQGDE